MKPAALVATVFLALVALAHLARLIFQVEIRIGDVALPMWPSALATLGPGGLALWLWREQLS